MKRILIALVALLSFISCEKESFVLWQLPSQIDSIGNSYVVQTANGKVIVMDGGFEAEKDYLRGFIDALGGKVDAWIISHPHDDHITAIIALLENPKGLKIDKIYHSRFPDVLIDAESEKTAEITRKFYSLLDNATDIEVVDCHCGDEFEIDGVNFKILSEKNPEMANRNPYNNSSMAYKMWDSKKSFIFLGDLGVEGGQKLLDSEYAKDLECDYLQMAHHGQDGCDKKFYQAVKFRACLWPSPKWVYNAPMGRLKTAEVRGWMKELGITEHYVSNEGLARIE
ncbi:MAG: MBL fold metallo-hydrolase [Rikenellaceae bacterium]|nr:MBL fold metallo-hydrolase [Rikenellaceae bacterium]